MAKAPAKTLDELAKDIREAHQGRIRTNIITAIKTGNLLLQAKLTCEQENMDFMPWVEENCAVKHAMANRYMNLYEWTADEPKLLEHIVSEEMGIEEAWYYLRDLQPDRKRRGQDKGKRDALAIDRQLQKCGESIKTVAEKIRAKLPKKEWEAYLTELGKIRLRAFFEGDAELPLPPSLRKAAETVTPVKAFPRPGKSDQPQASA